MSLKKLLFFAALALSVVAFLAVLFYYGCTSKGSVEVVRFFAGRFLGAASISVEKAKGSLSDRLVMEGVALRDISALTRPNAIEIQRVAVYFTAPSLRGLTLSCFNGRLEVNQALQLYFSGSYARGNFNVNVFGHAVDLVSLMAASPSGTARSSFAGRIAHLDSYLRGTLEQQRIEGKARLTSLTFNRFTLTDTAVSFDVKRTVAAGVPQLHGELLAAGGELKGAGSAVISIDQARVVLSGRLAAAEFNIHGRALVGKTPIEIGLKGTLEKPELSLASDPALPQEQLLLMLVTGREWSEAQKVIGEGKIPMEVARDFVDYFLLGGKGNQLARYLGVEVSVGVGGGAQSVEIKKNITNSLDLKYGISQSQRSGGLLERSQSIGGDLGLTDELSLSAERTFTQPAAGESGQAQEPLAGKDTIMLKFKKSF